MKCYVSRKPGLIPHTFLGIHISFTCFQCYGSHAPVFIKGMIVALLCCFFNNLFEGKDGLLCYKA